MLFNVDPKTIKEVFFYILVIINVVGAATFIYDKEASKWKGWRIRNWIMIVIAYLGALGSYIIVVLTKHKAKKFKRIFDKSKYIAGIQVLFIAGYYVT